MPFVEGQVLASGPSGAFGVLVRGVRSADLQKLPLVYNTVQGGTFSVSPALRITDQRGRSAGIAATDVLASNGVAHLIDKVILPAP